jgi:hypothetical protein
MTNEQPNERQAAARRIANTYPRAELAEWAWGILATPYDLASTMVAEDPSVMDVVAGYVHMLERELAARVTLR